MNADVLAERFRSTGIDVPGRRILVSRIADSAQEADLTLPPNCRGFGRIRHFRRETGDGWPDNPLPIDPAVAALGLRRRAIVKAQVFQNAVCNWRCWYCFVPFGLLKGDPAKSAMKTADDLVDLYMAEEDRPFIIDLSGGQPDLVPEWVPWMMQALRERGIDGNTYLWSDDNLSTDHFWTHLGSKDRDQMEAYDNYGKVCCFKGYDAESFTFNTGVDGSRFDRQFELFERLMQVDLDLYAYVTLTGPPVEDLKTRVERFVDRLQQLHPRLPLRVVPLQISAFGVVTRRVRDVHQLALVQQNEAIRLWRETLASRFSPAERATPITQVRFR